MQLLMWLIMDVVSGAWFSLKLIGGRYLALQPRWSYRSIVSSVTSRGLIFAEAGLILFGPVMSDSADEPWHPRGWTGLIWRHQQQQTQKKLSPHLVLQRRCILVRVPHGVKDVTLSGVWTTSRVKFANSLSEHPLIHTDVPTRSDRPKLLTDTALKMWWIHSTEHCSHWNVFTALNIFYLTLQVRVKNTTHAVIKMIKSLDKKLSNPDTQLGTPGAYWWLCIFSVVFY